MACLDFTIVRNNASDITAVQWLNRLSSDVFDRLNTEGKTPNSYISKITHEWDSPRERPGDIVVTWKLSLPKETMPYTECNISVTPKLDCYGANVFIRLFSRVDTQCKDVFFSWLYRELSNWDGVVFDSNSTLIKIKDNFCVMEVKFDIDLLDQHEIVCYIVSIFDLFVSMSHKFISQI